MSFLAFVALVYLGLCVAMFVFQRSFIYYPQPKSSGADLATWQLSVPDAQLQISVRPHDGPKALVYFGGNGEDVSFNLPAFSRAFPDYALYLLNYRGYGGSSGTPSEEAIQKDALVLFDRVHAKHSNVVVMGRSLGSGVAIRLASQRPVQRLVLITPYASLAELGARQFPFIPVKWLLRDKYESWRYAARITVPTFLVAAEHDAIIPRASTQKLYTHFGQGVASLQVIPDVGHNTISESPLYLEALSAAL
jgi:hypothetical protein